MSEAVIVHSPHSYVERGWPAIAASLEAEGRSFDVFFSASQGPLADTCDPFVPAALLTAMRLGVPLRVEGPVSPRLLAHAQQAQDVIARWYAHFKMIPIQATATTPLTWGTGGTGCFFSGGIDSFYSALKHLDQITELVFVHGFDVELANAPVRTMVAAALHEAAFELGKPLLEVETNVRELCDAYAEWNKDSHGAAMGCVALALAPQFRTLYIAATHTYDLLLAHGSSPVLDPLWNTEQMEVAHDGGETDRWRKLESMLDNEVVRRYLRSCWENRDGAYNCGHCNTCLQSMAVLQVNGVLDQFRIYPSALDLDELAGMPIKTLGTNMFTTLLLQYIEEKGTDPALAQALRSALSADPAAEAWLTASPEVRMRLFRLNAMYQEAEGQLWTTEKRLAEERQSRLELEGKLADAQALAGQLGEAQAEAQQARAASAAACAESGRLAAQLYRLTSSRSWRLTAPMRSLSARIGSAKGEKP